jgi:predicted nucleic acid-binding protein
MPYLVDSDWLIDYLRGLPEARALIDTLLPAGVAMSVISYMELFEGSVEGTNRLEGQELLRALAEEVPVLPFTITTAEECGNLRAEIRRRGGRVSQRALDLMIGATAIEHGFALVTRNTHDYADIPGLTLHSPA